MTGAAPIFHGVMLAAERRATGTALGWSRPAPVPEGSHQQEICALSGHAANAWCPTKRREWVAADSASLPCSWHHLADEGPITVWPAEYRAWADAAGLRTVEGLKTRPTTGGVVGRVFLTAEALAKVVDPAKILAIPRCES